MSNIKFFYVSAGYAFLAINYLLLESAFAVAALIFAVMSGACFIKALSIKNDRV